jgi:hypothetical protein
MQGFRSFYCANRSEESSPASASCGCAKYALIATISGAGDAGEEQGINFDLKVCND